MFYFKRLNLSLSHQNICRIQRKEVRKSETHCCYFYNQKFVKTASYCQWIFNTHLKCKNCRKSKQFQWNLFQFLSKYNVLFIYIKAWFTFVVSLITKLNWHRKLRIQELLIDTRTLGSSSWIRFKAVLLVLSYINKKGRLNNVDNRQF